MTSIQGIYIALYGRPADPAGLAHYTDVTNNGEDLYSIGDLSSVPEYQDRFADMSAEEIVTSIYESLFERAPDAEGLAFYVALLEESSANINRIAIDILNGAQNEDLATINAKIEAADLFTMHLDTDAEVAAYVGNDAAAIGREFIDTVNADDEGTGDEADTYILMLFPDEGQAPGEQPGSGGGSGGSSTTFSVSVNDGALSFGGNARGNVTVNTTDDGDLVFVRSGKIAVLDGETLSSLPDGVTILSGGASDVLAYNEESGWYFATYSTPGIDALDFYAGLGGNSNLFLLSGFDVEDLGFDPESETLPAFPAVFADIDSIEDVLALLSTSVDAEIVAADGANTSLNGLIETLIGGPIVDDLPPMEYRAMEEGPYLPNIGLPILLSGAADELVADSDTGFTLVGRPALTTTGGTPLVGFISGDVSEPGDAFVGATARTTNLTSLGVDHDGNALFRVVNTTESKQYVSIQQQGGAEYSFWLDDGQEAIVNVGPKMGAGTTIAEIGDETFTKAAGSQLAYGGNDTLTGGDGDDVLLGLGDAGTVDFAVELYAGGGETLGFQSFAFSDIDEVGEAVIGNGYTGTGVQFTAITEELPGGDNVMRISSETAQTVTVTKAGDADFAISVTLTAGDVAFVNVGDGGTYKLGHSGGEITKSTNNGDNPALEQDFDSDLVSFGDHLTGGAGADIFAYLYGDGLDLITDFNRDEGDSLLLLTSETRFFNDVDVDGDGVANDTFIAFYDYETGGYMLDAGIGIVGTPDVWFGDLEGFGAIPV